jgi:hypothetical protein
MRVLILKSLLRASRDGEQKPAFGANLTKESSLEKERKKMKKMRGGGSFIPHPA